MKKNDNLLWQYALSCSLLVLEQQKKVGKLRNNKLWRQRLAVNIMIFHPHN